MLPFKTIVIVASRPQRLPTQLRVGAELATRFQSHLVGLFILPRALAPFTGRASSSGWPAVETERARFRSDSQRMKVTFEQASNGRNFTSEWIHEDADYTAAASILMQRGRPADLIISGPMDGASKPGRLSNETERMVVESGRPVLLIPKIVASLPVGRRVLIAWNGSRESAKAAFDALPLLESAHHIKVLRIAAGTEDGTSGECQSAERFCQTLARHDVHATAETITLSGADTGSALKSAVKAENADLLVMGCHGRPRGCEFVLGSASQRILCDLPVPVLMSH